MRFGNGRDGLNIDPGETTDFISPDLGRDAVAAFPERWIQACIFPGMLAKSTGERPAEQSRRY
jgi:hypothetical protein